MQVRHSYRLGTGAGEWRREEALQGRIAAANVLSDLYAMGVVDCDNVLMLLAVSRDMTDLERDTVIPLLMAGFRVRTTPGWLGVGECSGLVGQDAVSEAGCRVEGGQTVLNPWLTIGGVASAVARPEDIVMPTGKTAFGMEDAGIKQRSIQHRCGCRGRVGADEAVGDAGGR